MLRDCPWDLSQAIRFVRYIVVIFPFALNEHAYSIKNMSTGISKSPVQCISCDLSFN